MIIAELHGKAPSYEGMEDILSANVFGALRYLPPEQALVPFLKTAVSFDVAGKQFPDLPGVESASYFFWPRGRDRKREPDLVLILRFRGRPPAIISVEAKHLGGKHNSVAEDEETGLDGDQLADQYDEIVRGSITPRRTEARQDLSDQALGDVLEQASDRFLLYVTAHYAAPREHFGATVASLARRGLAEASRYRLFWTSWRQVIPIFDKLAASSPPLSPGYHLACDLAGLLRRKRLVPYSGYTLPVLAGMVTSQPLFFSGRQQQGRAEIGFHGYRMISAQHGGLVSAGRLFFGRSRGAKRPEVCMGQGRLKGLDIV